MTSQKTLLLVARRTLREEGVLALLRRGSAHLACRVFQCEWFDVYGHDVLEWKESDFRPNIPGLTVRIVETKQQAALLPAEQDPRSYYPVARHALDRGGAAFCLYINDEFAHAGWIAFTGEAKARIDRVPFDVDFARGEACTGGSWTRPKFRGLGLMKYSYALRLDYLRDRGYVRVLSSVAAGNTASHKTHARFSPRLCSRVWVIRLGPFAYRRKTAVGQFEM